MFRGELPRRVARIMLFDLYNAEVFLYKPWRPKGFLNLKSP